MTTAASSTTGINKGVGNHRRGVRPASHAGFASSSKGRSTLSGVGSHEPRNGPCRRSDVLRVRRDFYR